MHRHTSQSMASFPTSTPPTCYSQSFWRIPFLYCLKSIWGKRIVTPSFSPSHCDMILEKIDQKRYFWSQLSITLLSDLQSAILCDVCIFVCWISFHGWWVFWDSIFYTVYVELKVRAVSPNPPPPLLRFFYFYFFLDCMNTKIKSLTQLSQTYTHGAKQMDHYYKHQVSLALLAQQYTQLQNTKNICKH